MLCAQDRDLAPFLGDLSQSEKLSEIKPPLLHHLTTNEYKSNNKWPYEKAMNAFISRKNRDQGRRKLFKFG